MAGMTRTTRRSAPPTRLRAAVALSAALALTTLAACSGDDDDSAETTEPPTAAERLAQAHDVLLEAGSVHLELAGTDLPEDQSTYIISASGDGTMDPPAFDGTITAQMAGIQADVPTVAVDGELYVKLPYVPTHVRTDPADLGVPDPANLFDPDTGLVSLLEDTEDPELGERRREGSEVVQEVTGTLPGQVVRALLHAGDADAEFEVTYGLVEEDWQVRTVVISGPFYPPASSVYTVTLSAYGAPVTVVAP